MATYTTERITAVQHWRDKLFSFATTRSPGLRFENGQFIMLGLEVAGRKIVRAYSIASANYEDQLDTTVIESGRVFADLNIPPLDPATDRFMICGNMRMLSDASRMLDSRGFAVSPQIGVPGDYVIERAFVESFDTAGMAGIDVLPAHPPGPLAAKAELAGG